MTRHYVHISSAALTQILMNGFEAFVVKHQRKKRHAIEMHASLYGRTVNTSSTIRHHIEFISVDTSAEMNADWVASKDEAWMLKEKIAQASGFEMMGMLHTHPYLSHEMSLDNVRNVGCHFSEGDLACFQASLKQGYAASRTYCLEAVLTIRHKKPEERQHTTLDGRKEDKLFEFSMAGCKCFLNFQVFSLDSNKLLQEEPTILKCPDLQKFQYLGKDFGTVQLVQGKSRILEHKS